MNTHLHAEHFNKWLQEAYPSEGASTPLKAGAVVEYGGYHSVHVATWGDPEGTRVEDLSPNYKGEHGHPGYLPVGIAVEGDGGNHLHLSEGNCPPPQRPIWVPLREGYWDGDPVTESGAGYS